jgi:filamentous hemagglutinin
MVILGGLTGAGVGIIACRANDGGGGGGGNEGGGRGGNAGGKNGWTNKIAREKAKELGFEEGKDAGFNSHNQLTFKSGNRWITPDIDGHSGYQTWKMFDNNGVRLGTFNTDLTVRLGD